MERIKLENLSSCWGYPPTDKFIWSDWLFMETQYPARRRPKYLNLFKIREPLPAIVSILHRISGVLLFFPGIPLFLYGLQMMLESPESFARLQSILIHPLSKLLLLFATWFFLHHLLTGIRHLGLDMHYGLQLQHARLSSKLVLIFGAILTVLAGIWLW
ncbi:succinate dehydrogenase subunit C [Nitrosomonas eutropha]|uniref:Succinate dehydrogenase cytochrome b556 subunit n=2 Tax=Nitrosomonas eutropha TaxID=916 RepID=A0A1I7HKZ1_9PROT|nr:succinate dehydrogenase subunit C [Nitrosomonas eutropha]